MANYTITLAEYLTDGGRLPAIFAEIEGLENLFIGRYLDQEIGFETPALFALKLEGRAALVVPFYKAKLDAVAAALEAAGEPTRKTTTTEDNTYTIGASVAKLSELPISGSAAAPTSRTDTDEQENTDDKERTYTEEGLTSSEALALAEYERDARNLKEMLLDEFAGLFMGVY